MQTENEPYTINSKGWTVRIRKPQVIGSKYLQTEEAPRVILLLHGRTGDENVMWIFTRSLPSNAWIFAPRAPLPSRLRGYTWVPNEEELPSLDEYAEPAKALIDSLETWLVETGLPGAAFDVMGFSQGAGLAYALAAFYPHRVKKIMALAGFLPRDRSANDQDPGRYRVLAGKNVYIAHGKQDETIPVRLAEQAVRVLQDAGAEVTYCESEVGHKLSAGCLKGIGDFI